MKKRTDMDYTDTPNRKEAEARLRLTLARLKNHLDTLTARERDDLACDLFTFGQHLVKHSRYAWVCDNLQFDSDEAAIELVRSALSSPGILRILAKDGLGYLHAMANSAIIDVARSEEPRRWSEISWRKARTLEEAEAAKKGVEPSAPKKPCPYAPQALPDEEWNKMSSSNDHTEEVCLSQMGAIDLFDLAKVTLSELEFFAFFAVELLNYKPGELARQMPVVGYPCLFNHVYVETARQLSAPLQPGEAYTRLEDVLLTSQEVSRLNYTAKAKLRKSKILRQEYACRY